MERVNRLKEQLLEIIKNDGGIPEGEDAYKLALEAMDNIGSTDPELRDDLILVILWKMITEKILNKERIRELLDVALSDKHLFYKLGEMNDDSVFNRAFTVLIILWIIYYHNSYGEDLLTEEEMKKVFSDVIRYIRLEKDTRGYVDVKGWAHAIAHSGDALRSFATCNYIKHDELMEILEVIKEKVNISYYVYKNEEAERLVTAVIDVIERNVLSDEEIINWIRSFGDIELPDEYPAAHYWKENVKNLLRSFYFRYKFKKGKKTVLDALEEVIQNINKRLFQ